MSVVRLVVAAILLVVGGVWLGQGIGLIGGSAMTGSSFWAIVGGVLVVVAAWLFVSGLRRRRTAAAGERR